jgi:hypothetical protein
MWVSRYMVVAQLPFKREPHERFQISPSKSRIIGSVPLRAHVDELAVLLPEPPLANEYHHVADASRYHAWQRCGRWSCKNYGDPKVTRITVPTPTLLCIARKPRCNSARRLAIFNPSPSPCCSNNARSNCMYAPTNSICSSDMP